MIELYKEALDILEKLPIEDANAEMSPWQLSYLCGLICDKRPCKILEIGVAAGGTTAVILNCLSKLDIDCQFFSIDVSEKYYRDRRYETGFLAELAKEIIGRKTPHSLLIGHAPCLIDKVGEGVDCLILDTVHMLPGEILDFLACFPYLADAALVILHDVVAYHFAASDAYYWATQILLDTVTADKMPVFNVDNSIGYPNIAAFKINGDTKRYIYDVFSALTLTWQYSISDKEIALYRNKYIEVGYSDDCIRAFDCACALNRIAIGKRIERKNEEINIFFDFIKKYEGGGMFLYGAGEMGKRVYGLLKDRCHIKGFIVSDDQKIVQKAEIPTYHLSEIALQITDEIILVTVNGSLQEDILGELQKIGIRRISCLNEKESNYFIFM